MKLTNFANQPIRLSSDVFIVPSKHEIWIFFPGSTKHTGEIGFIDLLQTDELRAQSIT